MTKFLDATGVTHLASILRSDIDAATSTASIPSEVCRIDYKGSTVSRGSATSTFNGTLMYYVNVNGTEQAVDTYMQSAITIASDGSLTNGGSSTLYIGLMGLPSYCKMLVETEGGTGVSPVDSYVSNGGTTDDGRTILNVNYSTTSEACKVTLALDAGTSIRSIAFCINDGGTTTALLKKQCLGDDDDERGHISTVGGILPTSLGALVEKTTYELTSSVLTVPYCEGLCAYVVRVFGKNTGGVDTYDTSESACVLAFVPPLRIATHYNYVSPLVLFNEPECTYSTRSSSGLRFTVDTAGYNYAEVKVLRLVF